MRLKPLLIIILFFSASFFSVNADFDPMVSDTYVDDDYDAGTPGWGVTHFDNVQDGVDNVDAGGTVHVYEGTYTEEVYIDHSLNLRGAGRNLVIIDGDGGSTIIIDANFVNISGVNVSNGEYGIVLDGDWNTINNTIITGNDYGFDFLNADNNTLFYNDIIKNLVGIDLETECHDNLFHHNNFENNSWGHGWIDEWHQQWNLTYSYPDLDAGNGNYFDDHWNFTDEFHGPDQDIPGSDGIVDFRYSLGREDEDWYPFMEHYYPPNENTPPIISDEDPENEDIDIEVTQATVSVTIEDTNDTFDWTIEGEHVVNTGQNDDTDGVKSANLITPLPYFTVIIWYVNATDSEFNVNEVYQFRTESELGTTIQEAIDSADEDDTVYVPSGIYTENLIINKSITLEGQHKDTTTIDGGGIGHVIFVDNTEDVTISGFTIQNSGSYGVFLNNSDNVEINNNIVTGNGYGIKLLNSDYNTIESNNINNNTRGIGLTASDENTIESNDIVENNQEGIEANTFCIHNTISENFIDDNGEQGIFAEYDSQIRIIRNTISNNHQQGMIYFFSDNGTIAENTVHSNWQTGIDIWGTSDTDVFWNNVSGNDVEGIRIYWDSHRNEIYGNDVIGYNYQYGVPTYQPLGIYLRGEAPALSSTHNKFYHNNFFDNVVQAKDNDPSGTNIWNDSYPSGGNYYDDFDEPSEGAYDNYRGHYQTISGEDGIIDGGSLNPYNITDGTSKDWYPLKEPYARPSLASVEFTWSPPIPKVDEEVTFTSLAEGGTIVEWIWDFGDEESGRGKTVKHTYDDKGYYVVKHRALNNRGLQDTSVQTIFIAPRGPFIEIKINKYPGFTIPEMYDLLRATELPVSDTEVTVFVIDSGVYPQTYEGIDLSLVESQHHSYFPDGEDGNGHGTWVAYAIAYMLDKKLPNSQQISYRIFGDETETTPQILLDALDRALELKPDIVSISAGAIGSPLDPYSKKVEKLVKEGIIVICAGGNLGPRPSTILSPAVSSSAFCVAGEDPQWYGDEMTTQRKNGILNLKDDTIAEWSSRGPVPDVYPKPDASSPGESILGPWIDKGAIVTKAISGTSMATPLISAGSAVVVAENKGLMETVKTMYFWDKSVVVTAFHESLRESCYEKGSVNDWGAGIIQFDKVSEIYQGKLMLLLGIYIGSISLLWILVIVVILWYVYSKRKGTWKPFGKARKWWAK